MGGLVMMQCAALTLTVSTVGCARLHQKAQSQVQSPWDAPNPCKHCAVGAAHAGVEHRPMAAVTASIRHVCPRCSKPHPRLIRGHHCISCYNRDREAAAGRNAKGTRPRLADVLHTQVVGVAEGQTVSVRVASRVASRVEAMLTMAKSATAPMAFGPARLEWGV